MSKFIDLTGKYFDKWTVIGRAEDYVDKHGYHHRRWRCVCSCKKATERDVLENSLIHKTSTSCGCSRAKSTHGLSRTRIKRIYYNMHSRCENPNTPKYENHGGRGISICKEWSGGNGLVNFYNWAIKNGYDDNLTIDRIDNDGNYEPSNCHWVSYDVQNRNKRDNIYITINGVSKVIEDWSRECGVSSLTIQKRLNDGITGEDLLKPVSLYAGCSSGFAGVFYRKDNNKWRASINKDGVKYNLGTHSKLSDAVQARLNGELEHYGYYLSDINDVYEKLKLLQMKEGKIEWLEDLEKRIAYH